MAKKKTAGECSRCGESSAWEAADVIVKRALRHTPKSWRRTAASKTIDAPIRFTRAGELIVTLDDGRGLMIGKTHARLDAIVRRGALWYCGFDRKATKRLLDSGPRKLEAR